MVVSWGATPIRGHLLLLSLLLSHVPVSSSLISPLTSLATGEVTVILIMDAAVDPFLSLRPSTNQAPPSLPGRHVTPLNTAAARWQEMMKQQQPSSGLSSRLAWPAS